MTVGSNDQILYINLIRMGFTTHNFDSEQRRIPVHFDQNGATITASLTNSAESTPPGYYMLFAFNKAGTPSMAKIVSVPQAVN
jgi:galactose oxidase